MQLREVYLTKIRLGDWESAREEGRPLRWEEGRQRSEVRDQRSDTDYLNGHNHFATDPHGQTQTKICRETKAIVCTTLFIA